jgi:uroporphyrin-III C-methyltransferase / precorrin-2 dehydrogenase / sirohydrochlorin ferrochelatase
VSNVAPQSTCEYLIRPWSHDDFKSAFAVVADVECAKAQVLCAAARCHTSLINIVDKPQFCTFQFGSIVNRSQLVIGISTGGAAPILAQNVRSRIESVLPQTVQALALKAAHIRSRMNARLKDTVARRNYWQAFFSRCFGGVKMHPGNVSGHKTVYDIQIGSVADLKVGDIRQLQMTYCIEYQSDIDPQILEFARREAMRVPTGQVNLDTPEARQHARTVRIMSPG